MKQKIRSTVTENPERDFRFGSQSFLKNIESKYGVSNVSSLESVKNKKIETSLKNFGVANPFQSARVQSKQQETMRARHGEKTSRQSHITNFDDYKNLESWLVMFAEQHGEKPTIAEAAQNFNVTPSAISIQKKQQNLHHLFKVAQSQKEEEFKKFLELNFPQVIVVQNDRTTINPQELDFFFPEHNFAVEISPTSTHHSSDNKLNYGKNVPKDKNYHLNKMSSAQAAGVELLTVFDWMPWDKVMEFISHRLEGSYEKTYARNTTPVFIQKGNNTASKKVKDFINSNHVLGFNSKGTQFYTFLEYKGEIVAAAAWGKPRTLNIKNKKKDKTNNISLNNNNDPTTIELVRMCFAKNHSVPGGASRLLKTFIKEYKNTVNDGLNKIITFSDNDLGSGKIYEKLGFDVVSKPVAQKNYVHPDVKTSSGTNFTVKGTSLHLAGADRLLKNLPGYQPTGMLCKCLNDFHKKGECLPSNTEIVESYGFLPVYNCGYKKWELSL